MQLRQHVRDSRSPTNSYTISLEWVKVIKPRTNPEMYELLAVAAKFFWPHPSILLLRYYLFESFVVVSLFPIDSEYESVMPQTQLEKEVVDCNLLINKCYWN